MIIVLLLILFEVLSLVVLRQHFYWESKTKYNLFIVIHIAASIFLWIMLFSILNNNTFFDTPQNVSNMMALAGMICAFVLPGFCLAIFHFGGKLINRKKGGHIRWLTNAGLLISVVTILLTGMGSFYGRFNFKYEEQALMIKGLHPDLEGLRIVQLSDLHLASFYHHREKLAHVMHRINEYEPDLIINTGDFVTFGWREFENFDSILSIAKGKYGQYAIPGNHDAGTYHPEYTEADVENNNRRISYLAEQSGYTMLNNSFSKISIGRADLALIGVITAGKHPHITHGNIGEAYAGLDSADLRILLLHDPNHFIEDVAGIHNDIKLTISGHTHGMQLGIMTRKFKWSPVKFFYPHWNGVYERGEQIQFVNRGLGVLAVPFRIWMPPQISILTLTGKG